jgi:uncharacterized protein YdaU (DUF1376 family)
MTKEESKPKKDPAFLFYPSDFLTGTMFMSNEQIGIYIRLLCSQHQHGGIIDKLSFNSLVGNNDLLRSKFIETETGFYNERLTDEMDKRNKKSNNMSEVAKEVWRLRKIQLYNKSKKSEYKSNTKVKKKGTIVIQPINVNINEVIDYFINNNYTKESAEKFFNYYSVADWRDGKGNPVKNWKQKAHSVWFKPENEVVDPLNPKMVY